MIHFLVNPILDHELAEALVATMNLTRVLEALTEQISDFSCEALKKKLRTMSLLELKAHAWINSMSKYDSKQYKIHSNQYKSQSNII
jgi:hypothetical protein